MEVPIWVTVILSIGSMVGGSFGVWLISIYQARNKQKLDEKTAEDNATLAKNKQATEIRISENEQAFKIYRDLVETLTRNVKDMTIDLNKLETDHLNCREENANLRGDIKVLRQEIDHLRQEIQHLKNDLGLKVE